MPALFYTPIRVEMCRKNTMVERLSSALRKGVQSIPGNC